MGIIQKQSIQSTFIIILGFGIGAFNTLILAPKIIGAERFGLTRLINDSGITLATLCTLGCLPVIYKFFPFYKSYLPKKKNDLPLITLIVCMVGFVIMCFAGYLAKDIIVEKFSENSPLFVEYSYLVYPFAFFWLLFIWLEAFSWSLKKGVISNSLKETLSRVVFTVLLIAVSFQLLTMPGFYLWFSLSNFLPVIILFFILRNTGELYFVPSFSSVTTRLKGKMTNFGFFVFGAQFLNLLSRTIDTFILSSKSEKGLTDVSVFFIATSVVAVMEVPQRSITSISVPVLAEAWKDKDMRRISSIYTKSVSNLLLIGLTMLGLIWLNGHNLAGYLGKEYAGIEVLLLFMGIGKLIDLGTGANSQILSTSSYWKVDFTTNVIYTIIAIPLNYLLIARYGLVGAAYATLISQIVYNSMRFGFLWFKFDLQPFTFKNLLAAIIAAICTAIVYFIPRFPSVFVDGVIRSISFLLIFLPVIYVSKISEEINGIIRNALQRTGIWKQTN
jgi:O-antigen/teichoic acid export membrane protein